MDVGQYKHAATITKSDTVALGNTTSAIYVGGVGDVKVLTEGGDTVTFVAVPAGTTIPVRATQVFSGGTSASNMVALWN